MKTKIFTTALFALFMISCSSVFAQITIFDTPVDTTAASMSTVQIAKYRILLHSELYSSINVITTDDIEEVVDSSRIFISLPFLEETNLTFEATSFDYQDSDNYTWTGDFYESGSDVKHGVIEILRIDGEYIGHMNLDHSSYELFDLTEGLQVWCKSTLSDGKECVDVDSNDNDADASKPGENPCENYTTRVLFLYTPAAAAAVPNINTICTLAVAQNNIIWKKSDIQNRLFLAGVPQQFSFNQNVGGDPVDDAVTLSNDNAVQTLRANANADVVVLMVDQPYSLAFGATRKTDANFAEAYCVMDVNSATNGRYTFTHEFQHVFGARHDDDPTNVNAHAKVFNTDCSPGPCIERRTIVANLPSGQSRIEQISHPYIDFNGVSTGATNQNNSEKVSSRLLSVANFFSDPIPKYGWLSAVKYGYPVSCAGLAYFGVTLCDDVAFSYSWFRSYNGITWSSVGSNSPVYSQWGSGTYWIKCSVNLGNSRYYNLSVKVNGCSFIKNDIDFPIEDKQATSIVGGHDEGRPGLITKIDSKVADENNMFSIFPNPSSGDFSVQFTNQSATNVKIIICDYTGKQIDIIETLSIKNGLNRLNIHPNAKLAKGLYFVKVMGLEKTLVKPLTIE